MGIFALKVTRGARPGEGVTGVQIESRRDGGAALHVRRDPAFFLAGAEARGEFYCAECGYGISVRSVLPECPMCRGVEWEEPGTGPFRRPLV
jgi:hypothetical protein